MASYRDRLPTSGGSSIVSVQRTSNLVVGVPGITNVTISPVDLSRTYLKVVARLTSSGVSNPRDVHVSVHLKDSTTIEIKRPATASRQLLVHIEVVSDSGCTVIRGVSQAMGNIPIPAVDLSRSVCLLGGSNSTQASTSLSYDYLPIARLTANNILSVTAANTSGTTDISWEVVSYV